jgi:hypothetical protein
MTTTPSLAVEPRAISISQYEALTSDIEIARQGAVESFDYEDPKGDKAARSYIAGLRKIRSRIESARKEAKSYAFEYGRAVDVQGKALEAQILGLIEPHQQALDAIAQREKDRVAGHEQRLQSIIDTVQHFSVEGRTSAAIADAMGWLSETETADMEEFRDAADVEIANGHRLLSALRAAAVEREKREAPEAAIRRQAKEQKRRAQLQREAKQAVRYAQARLRDELVLEVARVMEGKRQLEVANAIVDGTLHPAITVGGVPELLIDWGKVQ